MKNSDFEIISNDILVINSVIRLIKTFSDKNPIRKYKINYDKIEKKVKNLNKLMDTNDKSKYILLKSILRKLKLIIKQEIHSKIFYITGAHGGIIIDNIGFCEFDSPKFALNRLLDKMGLAVNTNMPYNLEIAICCLDWLKNNYNKKFLDFLKLFKGNNFKKSKNF